MHAASPERGGSLITMQEFADDRRRRLQMLSLVPDDVLRMVTAFVSADPGSLVSESDFGIGRVLSHQKLLVS